MKRRDCRGFSRLQAFAQLLQQGLVTAFGSLLTCAGIAIVLAVSSPPLALAVSVILVSLIGVTLWFRRASTENYLLARERISLLYGDFTGPYFIIDEKNTRAEFVKLWKDQPHRELPFRFGYPDNAKHNHLMITRPR